MCLVASPFYNCGQVVFPVDKLISKVTYPLYECLKILNKRPAFCVGPHPPPPIPKVGKPNFLSWVHFQAHPEYPRLEIGTFHGLLCMVDLCVETTTVSRGHSLFSVCAFDSKFYKRSHAFLCTCLKMAHKCCFEMLNFSDILISSKTKHRLRLTKYFSWWRKG